MQVSVSPGDLRTVRAQLSSETALLPTRDSGRSKLLKSTAPAACKGCAQPVVGRMRWAGRAARQSIGCRADAWPGRLLGPVSAACPLGGHHRQASPAHDGGGQDPGELGHRLLSIDLALGGWPVSWAAARPGGRAAATSDGSPGCADVAGRGHVAAAGAWPARAVRWCAGPHTVRDTSSPVRVHQQPAISCRSLTM
jgi:hypothetical protein